MKAELREVLGAEVGKFMVLPVTPEVPDGIQFGRVGGQAFQYQPAFGVGDEVADEPTPVAGQAVPDHQQRSGDMPHQVLKELDDLGALDRARVQSEVKTPPRDSGNRRQTPPVEVILQDRCLPSGRPGPIPVRPFRQSAFVDEDDGPAFVPGFFLISGQRFCFHTRMAASSRAKARPVGRWQLQPSCRRIRHTWPRWNRTPHSSSIKCATRHAVHNCVSYPSASGPCFNPDSIFFRSARLSRGLRPARPAFFSPDFPDSAICRDHRFTDWRCTPTRRATPDSDNPCFSSFAAFIRRFSNASKSRRTPAGFPMPRLYNIGNRMSLYYAIVNRFHVKDDRPDSENPLPAMGRPPACLHVVWIFPNWDSWL